MTDISVPFLPTVKCSNCHLHIDIRRLDYHVCAPTTLSSDKASSMLPSPPLRELICPPAQDMPQPILQRRSRERSNGLNNSVRRILQKIKGTDEQGKCQDNDNDPLSPTLSVFSNATTSSSIATPRSSSSTTTEDYYPQFQLLKQQQGQNQELNSLSPIRPKSRDRKKPPAELHHLITSNLSINDTPSCQICYKAIESTHSADVVKDPISKYSYHASCYCCSLCRVSLSPSSSFEFQSKLYCGRDYQVMKSRSLSSSLSKSPSSFVSSPTKSTSFSSSSAFPITTPPATRMAKMCYHCKKTFPDGDTSYKTFKNRIYCRSDFKKLFLPKCRSCQKPVEREAISAMDGKLEGKWHIDCFNCQMCHTSFPDNTFYVFENQPYCKKHYHYLNNSLCNRCHEGIESLCAHTAEGWRFHPNCFTCEVCQERLNDTYYVFESRIYCETHIKRQYNHRNLQHSFDKRRTQIYDLF